MAKQTKPKQRTDGANPSSSSSTVLGVTPKSPQTISDIAKHLLAVLDDIYTEEAGPKRSVQVLTTVLLSMREQVQKMVDMTSAQPSNADLLAAINAIRGKVDVRTDEIMQNMAPPGRT